MKISRLHRLLLLLASIPVLVSCEQELRISAAGETIPVVYALINPDDSVHSIRLTRSFKSEGNALESARIPDSICFDTLVPRIELYTESGWKYHELVFIPKPAMGKDEGIFTADGIQVYECRANLSKLLISGTRLVLNIQPDNGRTLISSVINYVEPPKIVAPRQGIHTSMDFYPDPLDVKFEDPPEFVRYELHVQFHILNVMKDGDTVKQTVDKVFIRNSENTGRPRYYSQILVNIPGDLLLAKVMLDVRVNPEVEYRVPGSIDLVLLTGTAAYFEYIDLNSMADDHGGKVTTNITGGVGVFAFRYQTKVTNFFLGRLTMDSLMYGRFTRHLNFKDW
ncbi:MAG: DUF4249 family protein [Bacteroidia bacterium]|nr:DUF4249 family protein [Bacteroidia bacterium]